MNRKDKLTFSHATNFARKDLYIDPGKTPAIVSIAVVNENNENDNIRKDCVDNIDSECEESQPPTLNCGDDDHTDELEDDDDDDVEQMHIAEELYQDFSMLEILGQAEALNLNFNVNSGTKSEIEKRMREIIFPRVEILV
jgi:hypothetical protein